MDGEARRSEFKVSPAILLISVLNITGMASIVDGIVVWVDFFKDAVVLYQTYIRAPIAYLFSWLPDWLARYNHILADIFIVWSGLFAALNLVIARDDGLSLWSQEMEALSRSDGWLARNAPEIRVSGTIAAYFVLFPFIFIHMLLDQRNGREDALSVIRMYLYLVAVFVCILFINWQLRKAGF